MSSQDLSDGAEGASRRVPAGESIVITRGGLPVARLEPFARARRRPVPREELVRVPSGAQADPGLRDDLRGRAGDTTDDLGPIR